jgi:hypothetical protein
MNERCVARVIEVQKNACECGILLLLLAGKVENVGASIHGCVNDGLFGLHTTWYRIENIII